MPRDTPTADKFFTAYLPAAIEMHHDLANKVAGSLCFVVHDQGAWTIRFGGDTVAIDDGIDLDADLVVGFSQPGFDQLLAGELNANAGEPAVMGDPTLLMRLGRVLTPPSSGGLAAQLAFARIA